MDRDLGVAGRAVVAARDGRFETRLVRVARPICRVPTLAIHLDRTVNDGFKINAETMLPPVLATVKASVLAALAGAAPTPPAAAAAAPAGTGDATARHHLGLVQLLASELGCAPADVRDFELCLFDVQAPQLGGMLDEFVFAPRLDNLCMTHSVVEGLLASCAGAEGAASVAADANVRVAAAFDHEEVGSNSLPGAASTMLEEVLARLAPEPARMAAAARRSFLVSADMAHAVHPNHAGLHEENHRPAMHGGVVIKANGNQRYATSAPTAFLFREVARRAGVPLQDFCVRQDMGCGSTIGPIVATRLGLRTVDVGVPQLSMHSAREMCGVADVAHALRFFETYFRSFAEVDESLRTDGGGNE
jgi:aspartyl aminopeptidase